MATTDILPFAIGTGANVVSQATYASLASTSTGYATGIAQSNQLNKTWRQSAFIAAGIANFCVAQGVSVPDDGNLSGLVANITNALSTLLLPRTGGTVSGSLVVNGSTTLSGGLGVAGGATITTGNLSVTSGALSVNSTGTFGSSVQASHNTAAGFTYRVAADTATNLGIQFTNNTITAVTGLISMAGNNMLVSGAGQVSITAGANVVIGATTGLTITSSGMTINAVAGGLTLEGTGVTIYSGTGGLTVNAVTGLLLLEGTGVSISSGAGVLALTGAAVSVPDTAASDRSTRALNTESAAAQIQAQLKQVAPASNSLGVTVGSSTTANVQVTLTAPVAGWVDVTGALNLATAGATGSTIACQLLSGATLLSTDSTQESQSHRAFVPIAAGQAIVFTFNLTASATSPATQATLRVAASFLPFP